MRTLPICCRRPWPSCSPVPCFVAAQRAELAWFAEAGKPFAGTQVRVISRAHSHPLVRGQRAGARYSSRLTGIRVIHEVRRRG